MTVGLLRMNIIAIIIIIIQQIVMIVAKVYSIGHMAQADWWMVFTPTIVYVIIMIIMFALFGFVAYRRLGRHQWSRFLN